MASDRTLRTPLRLVWSKKSASDANVHPLSEGMPAAGVVAARPTVIELRGNTGNATVSVGFQTADKADSEDDWGAVIELSSSYTSTDGYTYEAGFTDISASLTKRLMRFVISIKNASGTDVELVHAAALIDSRED